MSADRNLATRLRRAGIEVREVSGWEQRGRDFAGASPVFSPKGFVLHHTAGPKKSDTSSPTPSLGIIINGRSDLTGPLANLYLGFNGVCYVVAAGVANHAGLPDGGVCRGMHGNSEAWGLEVEHPGTFALDDKRARLAARIAAATLHGRDLPASQLVYHREWAPSRKPDLATSPDPGPFRGMVAAELKKLEKVERWKVSYLLAKRDGQGRLIRKDDEVTRDPEAWASKHPGAYQRGVVRMIPMRG